MKRPWTEREDALICRLREQEAGSSAIAARLQGRTRSAVECRIEYLVAQGRIAPLATPPKRRAPSTAAWTQREDDLIVELRSRDLGHTDIAAHFPHRTRRAVSARIRKLVGRGQLARQRSGGVRHRAWTPQEIGLLVKMRAEDEDATLDELAAALPHRTRRAIAMRIRELIGAGAVERTQFSPQSRRAWSREEDELVAEMRRSNRTMEEMAAVLRRTLPSVNSRIAQRVRKGELTLL